jgi:cell division inhibitor SepF
MFERIAEKFKGKKKREDEDIEFVNLEERTEAGEDAPEYSAVPSSASIEGNIELKVVRPSTFDEVSAIADFLIEGRTVVLNLELLDRATTIRMLDFLNGVTYTKDGEIKNVAPNTYIVTPSGIDIND